jgi:hypothetical protein
MIQKYIKVVLPLLCLLNLGISGSSGPGFTELMSELGNTVKVRDATGTDKNIYTLEVDTSLVDRRSLDVMPLMVNLDVMPLMVQSQPTGDLDRRVYDQSDVLMGLIKAGTILEQDSRLYQLYYDEHPLKPDEYFYNDDARLSLRYTDVFKDATSDNGVKITDMSGNVTCIALRPDVTVRRGLDDIPVFRVSALCDELERLGIINDRHLCKILMGTSSLNQDSDIYGGQTLQLVRTSCYTTSIDNKIVTIVFSIPDNHKYHAFTEPMDRGEFGKRIMQEFLTQIINLDKNKIFFLYDSRGDYGKLSLVEKNLMITELLQDKVLDFYCTGQDFDTIYIKLTAVEDVEYRFTLKYKKGINGTHIFTLTYERRSDPDDDVNYICYHTELSKDHPYGYAVLDTQATQEALVNVITKLQSEAAANPLQSAASSSGLGFAPPARSSTPATSSAGLGFTPPARSSTPATSSAGLGFTPPARSLSSSGYPNP